MCSRLISVHVGNGILLSTSFISQEGTALTVHFVMSTQKSKLPREITDPSLTIDQWFAQQDQSVEETYQTMLRKRGKASTSTSARRTTGTRKGRKGKVDLERLIKMRETRDATDRIITARQAYLVELYLDGRLNTGGHDVEVRLMICKGKGIKYLVVDGKAILPPNNDVTHA